MASFMESLHDVSLSPLASMPNQWQKAALELALKFRAESNVCAMSGLADILVATLRRASSRRLAILTDWS